MPKSHWVWYGCGPVSIRKPYRPQFTPTAACVGDVFGRLLQREHQMFVICTSLPNNSYAYREKRVNKSHTCLFILLQKVNFENILPIKLNKQHFDCQCYRKSQHTNICTNKEMHAEWKVEVLY